MLCICIYFDLYNLAGLDDIMDARRMKRYDVSSEKRKVFFQNDNNEQNRIGSLRYLKANIEWIRNNPSKKNIIGTEFDQYTIIDVPPLRLDRWWSLE
jgi:hypothetical protein